jgi:ligand-binding SRPBCC domain-containing protein
VELKSSFIYNESSLKVFIVHTLVRETHISASREEVFDFFSDARNLNRITPAWLDFRILTPTPVPMELNSIIEYSLKLNGLRFRWKTQITRWEPPQVFVDEQLHGPYSRWIHTHSFTETAYGTCMEDHVAYAVPGWLMEPLIHRAFVQPRLNKIFDYREQQFKHIFPSP